MRRVHCSFFGTDERGNIKSLDKAKINESLVSEVCFRGMHDKLKIFVKDALGQNYLLYWDYELIAEIRTDWLSFYYKGRHVVGDFNDKHPTTITYRDPDFGTLIIRDRGDLQLIYKDGEHVGNIAYGGGIDSWIKRIWQTKKITFNFWQGFEYDEDKIDHIVAAALFMTIYVSRLG